MILAKLSILSILRDNYTHRRKDKILLAKGAEGSACSLFYLSRLACRTHKELLLAIYVNADPLFVNSMKKITPKLRCSKKHSESPNFALKEAKV